MMPAMRHMTRHTNRMMSLSVYKLLANRVMSWEGGGTPHTGARHGHHQRAYTGGGGERRWPQKDLARARTRGGFETRPDHRKPILQGAGRQPHVHTSCGEQRPLATRPLPLPTHTLLAMTKSLWISSSLTLMFSIFRLSSCKISTAAVPICAGGARKQTHGAGRHASTAQGGRHERERGRGGSQPARAKLRLARLNARSQEGPQRKGPMAGCG
jgi:hypothetical protein